MVVFFLCLILFIALLILSITFLILRFKTNDKDCYIGTTVFELFSLIFFLFMIIAIPYLENFKDKFENYKDNNIRIEAKDSHDFILKLLIVNDEELTINNLNIQLIVYFKNEDRDDGKYIKNISIDNILSRSSIIYSYNFPYSLRENIIKIKVNNVNYIFNKDNNYIE